MPSARNNAAILNLGTISNRAVKSSRNSTLGAAKPANALISGDCPSWIWKFSKSIILLTEA
ncbi:hypothetical protein CFS9_37290 [Flavobacterium sp. CFS9]|uniref:Uncharacterized protein n=1 Tax=Flavobacterium sp. CFS9 TaxID=3143118 RepID=A0AAT9H6A3_9FLAO